MGSNTEDSVRGSPTGASPSRLRGLGAWAILVVATLFFLWPMFRVPEGIASGDAFRDNDWLNCRSFDLLSRQSILEHGQFPLRSHLIGGGFPVTAHPSDGSWAPTILAVLLLGDVLGVKVNLVLFFLAATFGVYALGRGWLGLRRPAAVLAALAFTFSAWTPSMMLVGFYHQIFFLLVPLILYCVLLARGRLDRLLWAGLLLCFVLQQGGHAFAAMAYFLGITVWLLATQESAAEGPAWRRWGPPLLVLAVCTTSLAVAKGLRFPPYEWGARSYIFPAAALTATGAWTWFSPRLRNFWRHLLPWAGRLSLVLGTALLLGAARMVGLLYLTKDGKYTPGLSRMRYWFFTNIQDEAWIERFYEGPGDLLRGLLERVPQSMSYGEFHGRPGANIDYEYAFLGLTILPLLLALAGMVLGRKQPRVLLLTASGLVFTLICLGWFVPPDFHFLLTWGIPWAGDVSQPIKYYNFFILLPLVLLAGVGADRLVKVPAPGRVRAAVVWIMPALLLLPLIQNQPILGELFKLPQPAPAQEKAFYQVAMVARPSQASLSWAEIRQQNTADRLRDYRRPRLASEYYNIRRGVGTVDWYGTVTIPEQTIPGRYITPEGKVLRNSRYVGEAWTQTGSGEILSLTVKPNTVEVEVALEGPDTVVLNQSFLRGFITSAGEIRDHQGLLAVHLQSAGRHRIRLAYRPPHFLAGLAVSGLAFLGWIAAQVVLFRRRRIRQTP